MKKEIFIAVLLLFSLAVIAGDDEFSKKDNWINLITTSKIDLKKFELLCPHFPSYQKGFTSKASYDNFVKERYMWFRNYISEVQNFMATPEIKSINPAPGDLGLDEMLFRTKVLEHPLWQRFHYAYISDRELASFAPHFPKPMQLGDSLREMKNFEAAVSDWKKLLPNEWAAFNNHPKFFMSSGLKTGQKFSVPPTAEKDLFKELPLSGNSLPSQLQFNSGNQALDKIRIEAYTKKYFWDNDKGQYYRTYEPEKLNDYLRKNPKAMQQHGSIMAK